MTIDCRTRGIPMRAGTHVDADGYHVFSLDETKHDPFDVLQRLMNACGDAPRDPEADARYEAVLTAQRLDCTLISCMDPSECKRLHKCSMRLR